jgi:zinc protease
MRRLVFTLVLALLWAPSVGAMAIERVVSPSGIEAWLVEDHTLPVVAIRFAFPGGAALDPAGKTGLAALAASLLDEGAGPYDTVSFQTRLEVLVTSLHFQAGRDQLTGSLRTLKRHLGAVEELLRLALTAPRFDPSAVERVRAQIVAALAQQAQNPRALAGRLWMSDAFEDHPYGQSVDGTVAGVGAITPEDLRGFVAERLHRGGLVIGAVGDLHRDELAALVERTFGALPIGTDDVGVAETRPAEDGALLITRLPVPQSTVVFGQAGPKRDDPDWYAARLLNDIIGGSGFRGRLMKEIREKRGLAYGVSSGLVTFRHAALILGNVATENARVAQSIDLIRAEWRRMRDDGPTETELDDAKSYLIGSFPLGLDSSEKIAALLVDLQSERLPIDFLDRRAALFGAVTLGEARRVARQLFDPDRLSFVVVGDPADLTPTRTRPERRF